MNRLRGRSPVLISGRETVNKSPILWLTGSRILTILYPNRQLYSRSTSVAGSSPGRPIFTKTFFRTVGAVDGGGNIESAASLLSLAARLAKFV